MKLSIRTLLTVPFIALTLAPVAFVGWLFYRSSQTAIEQSVGNLFKQISSRTEDQIKLYLATPHFINQLNASAIEQGLLQVDSLVEGSEEIVELETYFYQQVQAADEASQVSSVDENEFKGSINHIYLGTVDGIFRGAEYRPLDRENLASDLIPAISRGEADPDNPDSGELRQYQKKRDGSEELLEERPFPLFKRPWYRKGAEIWENGELAGWTEDPYCDQSTSRPAITAFRPVGIDNRLLGVLGSDFLFDDIQRFLQKLLMDLDVTGGHILVVDPQTDRLLISTSEDVLQKCDPNKPIEESVFKSNDPTVNALLLQLDNRLAASSNVQSSGLEPVKLEGERYYFDSVAIADPYGLELMVLIAIPATNFTEEISASRRTTYALAIGALLLTGILGLLISHWITKPVLQLEEEAQRLTDSPEIKPPLTINNPSELHTLANTFSNMSTRLIKTLAAFGLFVPQNFLNILGHKDVTEIERGAYKTYKSDKTSKQMTILGTGRLEGDC
ncbi:MAG: HAMP domain-containing protein [Thainema sp.]